MAKLQTVQVDERDITKQLTITVEIKNIKRMKKKMKIGVKLMKIAAEIMECNIEFKEYEPNKINNPT